MNNIKNCSQLTNGVKNVSGVSKYNSNQISFCSQELL